MRIVPAIASKTALVLLGIAIAGATPEETLARTLKVNPGSSVAQVLQTAKPGDKVVLKAGIHAGGFSVPSGVEITGEPEARIDLAPGQTIVIDKAENVGIFELTVNLTPGPKGKKKPSPAILIRDSRKVRIGGVKIFSANRPGIVVRKSTDIAVERCLVLGSAKSTGIDLSGRDITVANNVFSRHNIGVAVQGGTGITIADNLIDNSGFGAVVYGGTAGFAGNTLSGPGRFGFYANAGDIVFYDNAVRKFFTGLLVKGTAAGIIRKNSISQNRNGIVLGRPGFMVDRNTVSHNTGNGIVARPLDKSPAKDGRTVIRQNIISSNGGNGISVSSLAGMVVIRENLVENNRGGINVVSIKAEIVQNTIVLNQGRGLSVTGQAEVSVTKNIIANNSGGLHVGTPAKLKGGGNVIYANIVERGFQPIDANYSKTDWMPSAGGRDFLVGVFPAPHLKAKSDLHLDPGFVKLGKDYRLRPDSAIVGKLGREALPGAFPAAGL